MITTTMTTTTVFASLGDITDWRLFLESSPRTTQALWVAAGAILVLVGTLLQRPDARILAETGGPSIVGFEFAATQTKAYKALNQWGPKGQRAARTMLISDSVLIVGYVTFLGAILMTFASAAAEASQPWVGVLCRVMSVGVVVAGILDLFENGALLQTIAKYRRLSGTQRAKTATLPKSGLAPGLAKICAQIKFALLGLTIGALIFFVFPVVALGNSTGPNLRSGDSAQTSSGTHSKPQHHRRHHHERRHEKGSG